MSKKSRTGIGVTLAVVVVIGLVIALATTNPTSSAPASGSAAPSTPAFSATHNHQDMYFAQMMSVHHQGALDMSAMAPGRAENDDVKLLAAQIQSEQAPEIAQMQSWLKVWNAAMANQPSSAAASSAAPSSAASSMPGMDMPSSSSPSMNMPGMEHSSMPGMSSSPSASSSMDMSGMEMPGMTAKDMADLRKADGRAFDTLYLKLMIVHHQAGVDMAKEELLKGENPQALTLAADIIASQTGEIQKMQHLLTTLK